MEVNNKMFSAPLSLVAWNVWWKAVKHEGGVMSHGYEPWAICIAENDLSVYVLLNVFW